MRQVRLFLALLALSGGGFALWKAHGLRAEAESFANAESVIPPEQLGRLYPNLTRYLAKEGLYPAWPKELSPVEAKNRMMRAHRNLILHHRQLTATGWSLLGVSGLAFYLHTRCRVCRQPPSKGKPPC